MGISKESVDLVEQRKEELKKIIPEAFTEGKLDVDKLRQALGDFVENSGERYFFSWAGKSNSIKLRDKSSKATLKPSREESVAFDETNNIFIEGENLEVLKILQKAYQGKVKMIYIDPPYNTGKDFIYKDDFADPLKNYLIQTGQLNEKGEKTSTNTETCGRYHSNWLSMMYPRLSLARNLLSEDGVIFVSIDDNEVHNLRLIMNEIFGEENFVENFIIRSNPRGNQAKKHTASEHEYIVCYARDKEKLAPLGFSKEESEFDKKDENGEVYREIGLRKRGAGARREDAPNQFFPIYYNPDTKDISLERTSKNDVEILPKLSNGQDGRWRWSKKKVIENKKKLIVRLVRRNGTEVYDVFEKDFFSEGKSSKIKSIFYEKTFNYENATEEVRKLFDDKKIFDYPKPVYTIRHLCKSLRIKDPIILDFFAGSGTTAQAVLEQNAEDGGNRKFILVQLPEPTPEDSEARKAGYKTIADICKERIRRVIKKLKDEGKQKTLEENGKLDLGFKVFKLSKSNCFVWDEEETNDPNTLAKHIEESAKGASNAEPEALLYEVMLREGFALDSEVSKIKHGKNEFYQVNDGTHKLFACFDAKIDDEAVKKLALEKDDKLVLLDSALSDTQKVNLARKMRIETI
ncbi:MAG: site-specific DNA-methyltransferase [Candidatus Anstonellaceae archaeon]